MKVWSFRATGLLQGKYSAEWCGFIGYYYYFCRSGSEFYCFCLQQQGKRNL